MAAYVERRAMRSPACRAPDHAEQVGTRPTVNWEPPEGGGSQPKLDPASDYESKSSKLRVRHDGCCDPVRRDGQDHHVHGHLLRRGSEQKRAVLDAEAPVQPSSRRKRQYEAEGQQGRERAGAHGPESPHCRRASMGYSGLSKRDLTNCDENRTPCFPGSGLGRPETGRSAGTANKASVVDCGPGPLDISIDFMIPRRHFRGAAAPSCV